MYSEAGHHREIVKIVQEIFISNCFPETRTPSDECPETQSGRVPDSPASLEVGARGQARQPKPSSVIAIAQQEVLGMTVGPRVKTVYQKRGEDDNRQPY